MKINKEIKFNGMKKHFILDDISVLSFLIAILLFFVILDPAGVLAIIERDNIFVKNSLQNSDALGSGSKKSVSELLAAKPQFELKPLKPQKATVIPENSAYLIFGDSMMQEGIGSSLENELLAGRVSGVTREAIQSTGLLHPERLDWYQRAPQLVDQSGASVAIIMLGLNDLDGIYVPETGAYYNYPSDDWKLAYAQKVDKMLNLLLNEKGVKKVFWVGLAVSRDGFWNDGVKILNDIYKNMTSRYMNAVYVDTYDRFTVNGQYSDIITDDNGSSQFARQFDGNHLNLFGGAIMSKLITQSMREHDVHF